MYIYTEKGGTHSLIAPFVTVGIYIDAKYREIIKDLILNYCCPYPNFPVRLEKITIYTMMRVIGSIEQLQKVLRSQNKSPAFFLSIKSTEAKDINREGIDIVIKDKRRVYYQLFSKLLNNNIVDYENNILTTTEEIKATPYLEGYIAYIYSHVIRRLWLENYHMEYPDLEIVSHWGNICPKHKKGLSKLKFLPSFYIWSRAMDYAKDWEVKPVWFNQELNLYKGELCL